VVVGSRSGRAKVSTMEGKIWKKRSSSAAEWLELSMSVSNDWMGAPVINSRGEVIGLVTRGPGDPAVVVRPAVTLSALLARVPTDTKGKWLAEESPAAPAEGPLRKVPLAQNGQGRRSKLVYSPAPAYPSAARSSSGMLKGTGRFRLVFDSSGQVKNVVILRSTQNGALDKAAVDALRQWKATPGEEWTLNVPITFQ
jgi:TonB family protein